MTTEVKEKESKVTPKQKSNTMNILEHLNGFRGTLAVLVVMQHSTKYLKIRGDFVISCDLGL